MAEGWLRASGWLKKSSGEGWMTGRRTTNKIQGGDDGDKCQGGTLSVMAGAHFRMGHPW